MRILVVMALVSSATVAPAQPADTSRRLLGLWGAEVNVGSPVAGELSIDGRGPRWRAQVGGFDVVVERKGAALSFVLPGKAGEFRGQWRGDGQAIAGEWIQPPTSVQSNAYATPVQMRAIAPRVWRGTIVPLDPRVSFYVLITRGADGGLAAKIRNPEFGWFQRGTWTVRSHGNDVTFAGSRANNQFTATYDSSADQLTAAMLDGGPPVVLTRRGADDAVGFSARAPQDTNYRYRQPVADGDGWTTAPLAEVGIDEAVVSAFVEQILRGDPTDNALAVQSLLIARHGKLVLEEYFHGFTEDRPHDTRSAGKTFAPVLLGLARDRGAKVAPDTPVYSFFPGYKPFANWDARKAKMTVADLMSMTAGYDCDEDHSDSALANEDAMQSQTAQPDWYKYTLDAPMAHEPGGDRAYYCSAELNLVGGVAAKASGEWLPELFDRAFARPLQFRVYHLNLMPTGEAYMGGGAYIRARDQLKLGQLYLNGGAWNGRRVIDSQWVKQSLRVRASFENRFGVDHQYGWGWHISHVTVGDRVLTEYAAGGNGGQTILVFPELDLVIGFTGSAYGDFQAWGPWGVRLVPQFLIPAVTHPLQRARANRPR